MPSAAAGLDDVGDLVDPVLADAVAHGRRAEHDLAGGDHARLVDPLEQRLGDDRLQRVGRACERIWFCCSAG